MRGGGAFDLGLDGCIIVGTFTQASRRAPLRAAVRLPAKILALVIPFLEVFINQYITHLLVGKSHK
jgi:hypothetical protein